MVCSIYVDSMIICWLAHLLPFLWVKVDSPDGPVPPLVTGTFAGADFCFSMLGEASDKLSSASIADLTAQLDGAQHANKKPEGINLDMIKALMSKLPLGGGNADGQHDLDTMDAKKHAFDPEWTGSQLEERICRDWATAEQLNDHETAQV
ncbi:hypothetical protein Pst134EA_021027 [Puccinia striiformis f. sp. tritici]|nr:hypothetical protein Pst134EA_021027 [Puccinia striiformis f. sp. tritici]KAH9457134.1 hypothetical protein Pst134EA_021027 [Puccinia striiformis f. sp. tritici]